MFSVNEEERLLRAWVSPHGASVNLAIRENMIFSIETHLKENHWYHICQSWESNSGAWNFFLNGKLRGTGVYPTVKFDYLIFLTNFKKFRVCTKSSS